MKPVRYMEQPFETEFLDSDAANQLLFLIFCTVSVIYEKSTYKIFLVSA